MTAATPSPRYAIYFIPRPDTALYRFGASVLGRDCYTNRDVDPIGGVDALTWTEWVREPRVYGFHATLKAPFHLSSAADEAVLVRAVRDFAADMPAVLVGALAVRELGSFIALVPETRHALLSRLAQACVREFDRFRAPLIAHDRDRRRAAGLSARQEQNLVRWGYPYVNEDFRFHMTLTGPLATADRARALQFLCEKFERLAGHNSLIVDQIVLARQKDKATPFEVICNGVLGHSIYRPQAYFC